MRQASWIAFLLLTVGLLSYEATVSQSDGPSEVATVSGDYPPPEGGGDIPGNKP
jgi:hypothetical protein